jgi:Rieske Fe-S protein
VAFQHIEESVPPLQTLSPALTAALDLIIQRALEHDPIQRYSTAGKLVGAFERVLSVVGKAGVVEKKDLVEAEEPVQEEKPRVEDSQEELQAVAPFLGSMKLPVVRLSKEHEQRQGLLSGATPLPPVPQLSQISEVELSSSESGGWQFRPPIITNHMAAVKGTTGPQRALASYPPLPDLTAQKTQPGNLRHEEGELPIVPLGHHQRIDPATLILPADQHRRNDPDTLILPSTPTELANGEVFPMGTLDNARQFWQESEPAKDDVNPHVWLSNTPEMASFQSASMNPANAYMPAPEVQGMPAPLAVDKGRRKTLALLATGGVVTLGLLGLGGVDLAHFMQNRGRPASKVNIPAIGEKNPPKTLPKAVMIGKKSQPINSSLVFTNPSDKQDSLLIHLPNGNFVAYERACTHQQVPVNYDPQSHHLICPRHNSIFDPQAGAKVLSGPAPTPLKPVKIRINADGSIVLA